MRLRVFQYLHAASAIDRLKERAYLNILRFSARRRYEPKGIPRDVLDKILEAGRQAPSAANKQPWHFIVLTDSEIKKELSKGLFNRFIKDAPVTIVECAHKDLIAGKWSIVSTIIALQNMVVAHALPCG